MFKKLLLTGLMCLPMVAHAEDIDRTNVPVDHIAPFKDPDWRFILIEGTNNQNKLTDINNYNKIKLYKKLMFSKELELSKDEQQKVVLSIEPKSNQYLSFFIKIDNLNNNNIYDFIYNLKYKNGYLISYLNNKKIRIKTKNIYVKNYSIFTKYDYKHVCSLDYINKIQTPCEIHTKKISSYKEYIVPYNYSNAGNISISIQRNTIHSDGKHIIVPGEFFFSSHPEEKITSYVKSINNNISYIIFAKKMINQDSFQQWSVKKQFKLEKQLECDVSESYDNKYKLIFNKNIKHIQFNTMDN